VNLENSFQFITNLQISNNSFESHKTSNKHLYLAQKEDQSFHLTDNKPVKLSNQKIAEIAQKCLKNIFGAPNINADNEVYDFEKRLNDLENLKTSIQLHSDRIYKSKPWYAKVVSFFGIRSTAENQLKDCIKKINKQLMDYDALYNVNQAQLKSNALEKLQKGVIAYKDFYHKVLDSTDCINPLEGMRQMDACLGFIKELEAYKSDLQKNGKSVDLIDRIIKELEAAYDLETFQRSTNASDPTQFEKKISGVIHQIKSLKPDPITYGLGFERSNKIVILGGFQGHSMVYQIEKEKNGTYSFTTINTGDSTLVEAIRNSVTDIKYTGIKENDLTPEFIKDLLNRDNYMCMGKVFKVIDRHLGKKKYVKIAKGRTHHPQNNGTCSSKSISSWLKGELPSKMGKEFKAFMTERKLAALRQLQSSLNNDILSMIKDFDERGIKITEPEIKKMTAKMIQEGKKISEKRQKKIPIEVNSETSTPS